MENFVRNVLALVDVRNRLRNEISKGLGMDLKEVARLKEIENRLLGNS